MKGRRQSFTRRRVFPDLPDAMRRMGSPTIGYPLGSWIDAATTLTPPSATPSRPRRAQQKHRRVTRGKVRGCAPSFESFLKARARAKARTVEALSATGTTERIVIG
jgi:hypothetical protein